MCLDHMLVKFELSEIYKILSFLTENQDFQNCLWQSFDVILEDVSVADTIIEC